MHVEVDLALVVEAKIHLFNLQFVCQKEIIRGKDVSEQEREISWRHIIENKRIKGGEDEVKQTNVI